MPFGIRGCMEAKSNSNSVVSFSIHNSVLLAFFFNKNFEKNLVLKKTRLIFAPALGSLAQLV